MPVQALHLQLGKAFGHGPSLGSVIAFDEHGRLYSLDLKDRTSTGAATPDFLGWLVPSNRRFRFSENVAPGLAVDLHFALDADATSFRYGRNAPTSASMAVTAALGGSRLSIARGRGLTGRLGRTSGHSGVVSNLLTASAFTLPYSSIMDSHYNALYLEHTLHNSVYMTIGFMEDQWTRTDGDARDRILLGEVRRTLSNAGWFGLHFGGALEEQSLLGTEGSGALRMPVKSTTSFFGIAGTLRINDGFTVFGQASIGFTGSSHTVRSLIKEVSTLRSSAFAVGLVHDGSFTSDDRLMVAVSQPLRIEGGSAVIDRPIGRTPDGDVLRRSEIVGLEPAGREIDIELGYRLRLRSNGSVGINGLIQLEPGHNPQASPALGLVLRSRVEF